MTRYLLPKELGGGEVEETPPHSAHTVPEHFVAVWLAPTGDGLTRWYGYVPRDLLTPVAPPVPEEPGPGAWMVGETVCVRVPQFDGEYQFSEGDDWFVPSLVAHGSADRCWMDWTKVWAQFGGPDVSIVRLVPEPAKVALPWKGHDGSARLVSVSREGNWFVIRANGTHLLSLNELYARKMGAALLAGEGEP